MTMQGPFLTVSAAMRKGGFPGQLTGVVLGAATLLSGHAVSDHAAVAQPVLEETAPSSLVDLSEPNQAGSFRGENYLLGVGDSVRVDVFNVPDYGGEFRVLSGGFLNLPVVGRVAVEGLSLEQAAAHIEQTLAPFVRRPRVTLSVLETRPLQVAIAGEVSRPGTYQIEEDGTGNASPEVPTLTQVIELAGGITQLADIRQIEVERRLPPASVSPPSRGGALSSRGESTQSQTLSIDLWALLQEGDLNEDLRLQDGDRILVPTATALNPDEAADLAAASFSPDEISINVVGEVDTPGMINVPPNTPLNQALLMAGGFNNRARRGSVNLVRLNPNGTVSQREIEIDFDQGIDDDLNPPLRPNDTVVVQRSGIARVGDAVGTVLRPIRDAFGVLRLFGL
ncbi:MAG: SLBB domain-containing protein [Cyanobacteria bacterium P01_D01_bin.44]